MAASRLVAEARIHLIEADGMPIRLPREERWGWPVVFAGDTETSSAFMMCILPLEPIASCRWVLAKVGVIFWEGERFLTPGSRFIFPLGRSVDGTVQKMFGEGVVERVEQVSEDEFERLFGASWEYY